MCTTSTSAVRWQNGPTYRQWWANELHPKDRGFDAVAKIIADTLDTLGPV